MSADRWSVCPVCRERFVVRTKKMAKELEEKYGDIPKEDWIELYDIVTNRQAIKDDNNFECSLRENYYPSEVRDGTVVLHYYAHCEGCGLTKRFKIIVNLLAE